MTFGYSYSTVIIIFIDKNNTKHRDTNKLIQHQQYNEVAHNSNKDKMTTSRFVAIEHTYQLLSAGKLISSNQQ